MKAFAADIGRAVAIWGVLVVGQAISGMLFFRNVPAFASDGPVGPGQALLVAGLADAIILTLLAPRMRARGLRLGLLLATVLFGVQTLQSAIETVVFNGDLRMSSTMLAAIGAAGLFRDALAGVVVAMFWRGSGEPGLPLNGLTWKAPVIAAFYVLCYFTAGNLIAWRSAAVRAFYAHVDQMDMIALTALQFGRGLIWCWLAWLLARSLAGPAWRTALLTGLAFSGFMILQLLFPNPFMPWPVRAVHMVEVGLSNFLFGAGAALVLRMEPRDRVLKHYA